MSSRIFLYLFIFLLGLDLFQVYDDGIYRYLTKPLIMLSLIGYYLFYYCRAEKTIYRTLFLVALIAALGGDVFLLYESQFIFGLLSFLIMQVLYTIIFWADRKILKTSILYGLLLLTLIITVATMLWDQLGVLKIPVIIYMLAIASMSFTAFSRNRNMEGYLLVFLGTILFVISDTVLSIHQFDVNIDLGKLTVMTTYGFAQYFIVQGYISGERLQLK